MVSSSRVRDESPGTVDVPRRILRAVADREGVDTTELPPLYDVVDPDALRTVVETMDAGRVEFHYCGYEVTVHGDGRVTTA